MFGIKGKQLKIFLILGLLVLNSSALWAQLTDLVRLEYSFIPKADSQDDYNRFKGLVNLPIKVKDDAYLILGAEYNRIILQLEDDYPFDTRLIRRIHVFDLNLGYTFKLNDNWRVAAKLTPRIASTLNYSLTSDDIFLNGALYFINELSEGDSEKDPYRLILGLSYDSTLGIPFPLPIINYHRELNENWSFSLGVPKSNLKYSINETSNLQTFLGIDGYFAHIQRPIMVDDKLANNISLSVIVAGIGYEYSFTKHLISYIYTGYTLKLKNEIRDTNRDQVSTLNDVRTVYFRTGIKFKI